MRVTIRWPYVLLTLAAAFATTVVGVLAWTVAAERQAAQASASASSEAQERYRTALAALQAHEAEAASTTCDAHGRIVVAVQDEARLLAALDGAAAVLDASSILPSPARAQFEESRVAALASLDTVAATADELAIAAGYPDGVDVVGTCMDRLAPTPPSIAPTVTLAKAEALEAEVAALPPVAAPDPSRLDAFDEVILSVAGPTMAVADARVDVDGLEDTGAALAAAAASLADAPTPDAIAATLEALLADAEAAISLQQQAAAAPQSPAPTSVAPAPVVPVVPAQTAPPSAQPTEQPTEPTEPAPSSEPPASPEPTEPTPSP